MNQGVTVEHHLIFSGPIPAWAVALLLLFVLASGLWFLRAEVRRRRRPVRLKLLMGIRAAIILLLGLFLAQPVLVTRREERKPAALIFLADRSRSMLRTDAYGPTRLLDLGQTLHVAGLDSRATAPGQLAAYLETTLPRSLALQRELAHIEDELAEGLPWSDRFTTTLTAFKTEMNAITERLRPLCAKVGDLEGHLHAQTQPASSETQPEPTSLPDPKDLAKVSDLPNDLHTVAAALESPSTALIDPAKVKVVLDRSADLIEAWKDDAAVLHQLQFYLDTEFLTQCPPEVHKDLEALTKLSRFDLSRRLAQRIAADPEIVLKHHVELVGFDPLDLAHAEVHTDLFAPIEAAMSDKMDATVAGMVLFSDGGQNVPDRPAVMTRLTGREIPFMAAGVGLEREPADVAVVNYEMPAVVQREKPVDLKVYLKTAVPAGTNITLKLSDGDKVLAGTIYKADGHRYATVDLTFRLSEKPQGLLTLSAKTPDPDADPDNDQASIGLTMLDRQARVLLVAPSPRWDLAALMRVLSKSPVRTDTVFWDKAKAKDKPDAAGSDSGTAAASPAPAVGGTDSASGSSTPAAGPSRGKIPTTLSGFKRYDLIILDGQFDPVLTDADIAMITAYVQDGGRLMILDSAFGGPSYVDKFHGLVGAAPATQPSDQATAAAPPTSSAAYPAVMLTADPAQSVGIWQSLAQPRQYHPVPAQALSLLAKDGQPLLSVGFFARGRVYVVGSRDLFRLREWDEAGTIDRFLFHLVEDTLEPPQPDSAVPVSLYPRFPVAGSTAWVIYHAKSGTSAAKGKLTVEGQPPIDLTFSGPTSAAAPSGTADAPEPTAEFVASVPIPASGPLTVQIDGQPPLVTAAVAPIFNEDIEIRLDEPALRRIAGYAKGDYLPFNDLSARLAQLPAKIQTLVWVTEWRLWNGWGLLLLLATLMTIEWVLRRRSGMAL